VSPAFVNPVPIGGGGRVPERVRAEVRLAARQRELEEADRRLHDVTKRLQLVGPVELRIAEVRRSLAQPVHQLLEREPCLTVVLPRRQPGLIMRLLGDDTADIVKRSPVPVTLVP
jgi:nucleotide-binding universal stress UspA family protein